MRREEARSGPREFQLERGGNEKRPMKGRLWRGQRRRRKTRKVMTSQKPKETRVWRRKAPSTSSKSSEAVGYDWTLCVGFGHQGQWCPMSTREQVGQEPKVRGAQGVWELRKFRHGGKEG